MVEKVLLVTTGSILAPLHLCILSESLPSRTCLNGGETHELPHSRSILPIGGVK